MKVLHVHVSDYVGGGGGAIAMYRLHRGLKEAGFDSKILCATKTLGSSDSIAIRGLTGPERLLGKATSRLGLNDLHYYMNSLAIRKYRVYLDADVLNLHSFRKRFSYLALPSLTASKPAIFTLHDVWPFTGHCAVNYDCDRWKTGCGRCPYPDAPPAIRRDSTRLEWKLKNWAYSRSNLVFVTLSARQTELARQSMLGRFPIHLIPNGIDTEVFEPLDPQQCQSLLGIRPGEKVLMFSALDMTQFWKGGDLLLEALRSLPESLRAQTILLLLGKGGASMTETTGIRTLDLGYISNDRVKAVCYSAADLFVHPTRADSLPLVVQESMACGTPVVACGVGGVLDLVRPGRTGYLAKPEDARDLRDGIIQLLEDESLRNTIGRQCRETVLGEYSLDLQVQRYVALYRLVLQGGAV